MKSVCAILAFTPPPAAARANALERFASQLALLREHFDPSELLLCTDVPDWAAATGLPLWPAQAPGPDAWPWTSGLAQAFDALRGTFPGRPALAADLSRGVIDAPLLEDFLAATGAAPAEPLLAVRECRDHPCQVHHFWAVQDLIALRPKNTVVEHAWPCSVRWSWRREKGADSLLRAGTDAACGVFCEAQDAEGRTLRSVRGEFGAGQNELPFGELPKSTQTLFVTVMNEDPRGYHFVCPLADVPELWRRDEEGAVVNERTGHPVAGRQDFPAVYEPDGLLAYLPAGLGAEALAPAGLGCWKSFPLPPTIPGPAQDLLGDLAVEAYLNARQVQCDR